MLFHSGWRTTYLLLGPAGQPAANAGTQVVKSVLWRRIDWGRDFKFGDESRVRSTLYSGFASIAALFPQEWSILG